jgi:hypothetical protein
MIENPIDSPIGNPGVSPTQRPIGPDTQHPMSGAGEDAQPKPFTLGSEPSGQPGAVTKAGSSDMPSPMDLAREGTKKPQWSVDEMQDQMAKVQSNLGAAKTNLLNPDVTQKLTEDHYNALNALTNKMTPDMRTIAKETGGEFATPTKAKGETVLGHVLKWIGSSQDTMSQAITAAGNMNTTSPNPASFLKLQFAMHRAQERSELFSSILSSGVGTVKQIMSTQLG